MATPNQLKASRTLLALASTSTLPFLATEECIHQTQDCLAWMHWPSWCSALCWSQWTLKSGDPTRSYLGFTRSTDVALSKYKGYRAMQPPQVMQEHCPNRSTGAHPPRRHQSLVTHVLLTLCVCTSQPRAAQGLQHACDCRDCGESASTWAVPTFWGFLATWKSLNVLCCTAKAIWTICPQMGKALAALLQELMWLSWARVSCQTQVDCSVSCPQPHHRGYPRFCILWHVLNSTFHYPDRVIDCFSFIYFPSSVWHFYFSNLQNYKRQEYFYAAFKIE